MEFLDQMLWNILEVIDAPSAEMVILNKQVFKCYLKYIFYMLYMLYMLYKGDKSTITNHCNF